MDELAQSPSHGSMSKDAMRVQEDASEPRDTSRTGQSSTSQQHHERDEDDENVHGHHRRSYSHTHFRTYKRRWFGLAQLVLLNIVVSWDVRIARLAQMVHVECV